jgi:alanine dehydrogenase
MVVGIPNEIKDDKGGRVSMQPDGVVELVHGGREVAVQSEAGAGAGFRDE